MSRSLRSVRLALRPLATVVQTFPKARRLTMLGRYTPTHPAVLQIERQLRIL